MGPHHFMVLFRVQRHNSRSDLTVLVARDDGHLWFFLVRKFVVVQREKHVGESLSICWTMSAWNHHEQGHPFAERTHDLSAKSSSVKLGFAQTPRDSLERGTESFDDFLGRFGRSHDILPGPRQLVSVEQALEFRRYYLKCECAM